MKKHIDTIKRTVRKKRAIFIIVLSLFLLVFTLFRNSFLGVGLEVFLNSKFKTERGIKCRFDKMVFESNGVKFFGLDAYSEEFPHIKTHIDALRLGMRFNLKEFEVDPIVDMSRPRIEIEKAVASKDLDLDILTVLKAITRHIQLNILEGELVLVSQEGKEEAKDVLDSVVFTYKSNIDEECFGNLAIARTTEELSSPMMEVSLSLLSGDLFAYFDLNRAQLSFVSELNEHLGFLPTRNWNEAHGQISGNALLHLDSRGKIKRGDIQVELDDIHLKNSKARSELRIGSATWRSSFPLARNKERAIRRSWVDVSVKSSIRDFHYVMDEHTELSLAGRIVMNYPESEGVDLRGMLNIDGITSQIIMKGDPYVGKDHVPKFGMLLSLRNETEGLSTIDCHIEKAENKDFLVRAVCNQVDVEHLNLIQKMLAPHIPQLAKLNLKEGKIECAIGAEFGDKKFKKLHIDQIIAHNLHAHLDSNRLIGFCSKLEGNIDVDLEEGRVDRWNIQMNSGDLVYTPPGASPIIICDVSMAISSELDTFSHSTLKGRVFDHTFDAVFYGTRHAPDVDITLRTNTEALSAHIPVREKAQLPPEAEHTIHAHFARERDFWRVRGEIGEEDPLTFGFKLTDFPLTNEKDALLETLGHHIFAGWFKGRSIDEAIYQWVTYLLDVEWALHGTIDVMGRFDGNKVKCDLSSRNLMFNSESVDIDVREKNRKRTSGSLVFTYENNDLDLHIPIKDAHCRLKEFGLEFSELSGDLYIRDDKLFVHDLRGHSYGLTMQGQIDLKFIEKDPSLLRLQVNSVDGTLTGLTKIASHFPDFDAPSSGVEGKISALGEGFIFTSKMSPLEKEPEWKLHFHISDGTTSIGQSIDLVNLETDVLYCSANNAHELTNISGNLNVHGKPTPYMISGKYLRYNTEKVGDLKFDVQLEDDVMTLAQLVGQCEEAPKGRYSLTIDSKQSHYLGSALEFSNFITDLDFAPKSGEFQFDLDGKDMAIFTQMMSDLAILPYLGFLNTNDFKCHDFVQVDTAFNEKVEGWNLDIQCREVALFNLPVKPLHILAEKKGSRLEISEGSLGEMHFAGKMHFAGEKLIFDRCEGTYLGSSVVVTSGDIDLQNSRTQLNFQNSLLKMEEIKETALFTRLLDDFALKDFAGNLYIEGAVEHNRDTLSVDLSFHSPQFGESALQIASQAPCKIRYNKSDGFAVRALDFNITYPELPHHFAGFCIDQIAWSRGALQAKGVEATVSPEMIFYIVDQKVFDPFCYQLEKLQSQIPSYEWDHLVQLKVDIEWDAPHYTISGLLKEGEYSYQGKTWKFRRPEFYYRDQHLQVHFATHLEGMDFEVLGDIDFTKQQKFELQLSRFSEKPQPRSKVERDSHQLHAAWHDSIHRFKKAAKRDHVVVEGSLTDQFEVRCESIEGSLFGCDLHFAARYHPSLSSELILTGYATLHPEKAVAYVPESVRAKLGELQLSEPVILEGDIMIDKGAVEDSYFKGLLKGRDLHIAGYELRNLMGNLTLSREGLDVRNFRLSDQAGMITIDQVECHPRDDNYEFQIKKIHASEFRPSLLRKIGEEGLRAKPFVMRELKVDLLKGNTSHLNTIQGKGTLRFHNTFKTEHSTRLIPLELITRLGLDLGLLVPVRGEIDFQVEEERIKLLSLRDSFSEGKRSHFFFPSASCCYIDFDGDMHIDVKMKQYVLFKITQPFMISLRGSVANPKYSLK